MSGPRRQEMFNPHEEKNTEFNPEKDTIELSTKELWEKLESSDLPREQAVAILEAIKGRGAALQEPNRKLTGQEKSKLFKREMYKPFVPAEDTLELDMSQFIEAVHEAEPDPEKAQAIIDQLKGSQK